MPAQPAVIAPLSAGRECVGSAGDDPAVARRV